MNAIEIISLTKTFKVKKGATVEAVRRLSLTMEEGEIFGFLGPNGAGKSTTIKVLMGLIKPTAGNARIMGHDTRSPLSRMKVGFLPENPAFYDYLTAEEYLRFVGRAFHMAGSLLTDRSEAVLKQLELWDARKRAIRGYSKGMAQRLGIAQALLHDPDVYILDEPMSGLDPIGRVLVKNIILELKRRNKTVFFSTHITSDVETVCDRVGIIFKGALTRVERVASILTEGIEGYYISIKTQDAAGAKEIYVSKERLAVFLAETQSAGMEVAMIEPKRKNLEDYLLDAVSEKIS